MENKNNIKNPKDKAVAKGMESGLNKPVSKKSEQNSKQDSLGGGLTKEDLPDATNESTGKMGSGQRQDSN